MTNFARDLQNAFRTVLRKPSFAALAVLTLAAGIALNVTVAAVIDAYLLRSLPYPDAERLYDIRYAADGQPSPRGLADLDWRSMGNIIEHAIAWDLDMFYLTGGGKAESAPGAWVTPGFMAGLGIKPQIGRAFREAEFNAGAPQVALISHALWQRRFGGDPAVLGRQFRAYVSDRPDEAELFTIVGVLPRDFWHINRYTEVLAPLRAPSYPYMVTLRGGVTAEEAAERIGAFVRRSLPPLSAEWSPRVMPTHAQYASRVRPVLVAAAGASAVVLMIACSNVAFLLMVRAAGRHKEVRIREALGASRARIAQMLGAEALVLGGLAAAAALGLVWLSLDALAQILQQQLGRPAPGGVEAIALSWRSAAVALASMAVTLLFGLLPVLTSLKGGPLADARAGGRTATSGRGATRVRRLLIAAEIAGSVTLVVTAGLMIRTTWNLLRTDFGFEPARVLVASIGLRQRAYPDDASRAAFAAKLLARLDAIPGVRSAAVSVYYPLQQPRPRPVEMGRVESAAAVHQVSPRYFEALSIKLAAGRSFNERDWMGSEPAAIVSESLAARLARNAADVIGKQVVLKPDSAAQQRGAAPERRLIVGVARDVRQSARDEDPADVYLPVLQSPSRFLFIYLSAEGTPSDWTMPLEGAVQELDPELSLDRPAPLGELVDAEVARPRFLAWMLSGLALFAGVLAVLGVYGLVSFAARQQEREVAIRMAVGARPGEIVRLILGQHGRVVLLGMTAGLCGATQLARTVESQLFGVAHVDPPTMALTAVGVSLAAAAAMAAPAQRAVKTDVAAMLRDE
jgi:putative ABC transport system permease protein